MAWSRMMDALMMCITKSVAAWERAVARSC